MRKTFLLLLFVAISSMGHSQVRFNIFAGPHTSTARYRVNDTKQPHDYKYGFHAGGGLKVFFDNHLYFSPAIFYSLKGYKVRFNQSAFPPDSLATDNQVTVHTLELAILLQFDFGNRPSHFFIKGGPSLDFQLSGKEKFHLKNGSLVSRSMPWGFAQYGRYTAGLLIQLGFEAKSGFFLSGDCHLGLGNINNADGGPSVKHRVYGVTIGTFFNKKPIVLGTSNKE